MSHEVSTSFPQAFRQVQELAATFSAGSRHYLSSTYQEQEARQDFIDKFWMALGWDVHHATQTDPYAQEVKVERGVTMSEGRKRADYAFYLSPEFKNPRFFVEAKKPSVEIAGKDAYFQALRYGWNGGTPLVVLTDFEQFHVLDSRARPDVQTALSHAVQTFHYTEYADPDKFGAIYWLFSREAVAAGKLDAFVQTQMPKAGGKFLQRGLFHGGTQGIDESFLRDLDEYRWTLARAFHAANPTLDSETLTEATQRVLDRLVFLRFLEDKLIEPEPMVAHFGDTGPAWDGFLAASRRLDRVYNGNIFKPHLIDAPRFHAPDSVFGQICSDLSSEQSPYLFNLIPIHILGSIYERFLGKVIVVDDAGAKVEEKPEVRKAGGVYYTPDYIVRYIVDHTVGTQIAGKSPAEIAPLRFADIACGSGSFLLGVYDALLRYHTAYFNAKVKGRTQEAQKAGCEKREGVWHLNLWQKRDILLQNVWGVDIDAQAVEVAQMSLYLKLLEEETTATAREQNLLHGAILPTLNKNIVFGNSLIGTDILQDTLFEPAEERKLNPLDFQHAFPQIMKTGGFDAIVGNPPYGASFSDAGKNYIRTKYKSYKYKYDSYIYFIENALNLLKVNGYVSFITPELWLKLENGLPLRKLISEQANFDRIKFFGDGVFAQAVVSTVAFVVQKGQHSEDIKIEHEAGNWILERKVWQSSDTLIIDNRFKPGTGTLVSKIGSPNNKPLSHYGEAIQGLTAYDKYKGQSPELIKSRSYHSRERVDETYGKWLAGGDISRYDMKWSGEWLSYGPWLGAPRDPRFFNGVRLLFREIPGNGKRIQATSASETYYHGHSITPFKIHPSATISVHYLLGVVCSNLISWYGGLTLPNFGKDIFPKINPQDVKALPIAPINFSEPTDAARHEKMVKFVEQMLAAKKQRAEALTDRDIQYWQRRCDTLDGQIDALVYELYGLTDEEIHLVEGAGAV